LPPRVKFHDTSCIIIFMTRPYQLKRRAERQAMTRRRIIEAAIELHETIGPAAATVSDIAERAGVGRVTVYRHFPDELTLARACSGRYFERRPVPDPDRWRVIADPNERLRAGLRDTYAYHRATEAMMTHVLADARDHPVMAPYHAHWQRATDILAAAWHARGGRRTILRAGIALALSFDSWRTLVREQHLTNDQAVELMLRLTAPERPSARTTRQARPSRARAPRSRGRS
jgi:AcrR family transcriptional regulator